jgi:thioredoxin reductase (NADPH)
LGQLNLTTEVENYAGFPAGDLSQYSAMPHRCRRCAPSWLAALISTAARGPELMELMRQQAKNFGTRIVTDDIVKSSFQLASVQAAVARR